MRKRKYRAFILGLFNEEEKYMVFILGLFTEEEKYMVFILRRGVPHRVGEIIYSAVLLLRWKSVLQLSCPRLRDFFSFFFFSFFFFSFFLC